MVLRRVHRKLLLRALPTVEGFDPPSCFLRGQRSVIDKLKSFSTGIGNPLLVDQRKFDVRDDWHEGIVGVMCDPAGHLSHSVQPLSLYSFFLTLPKRLFGPGAAQGKGHSQGKPVEEVEPLGRRCTPLLIAKGGSWAA